MPNTQSLLLIRMEIPIEPALIFSHWLPIKEYDFIRIDKENMMLKFWFDLKCTMHLGELDEAELSRWTNVGAIKIFADVTVKKVRNELLEYIKNRDYSKPPKPEEQHLQEEYEKLGKEVYVFTLSYFNRLIAYTRTQLGQYWLQEFSIKLDTMGTDFANFKTKARVDESNWIRWSPTQIVGLVSSIRSDKDRFLTRHTWSGAAKFVSSSNKTNLILELLAGAERLAENGHTRSALTEAVTALEVAVHEFGRDNNANLTFGSIMASRLGTQTLKKQIEDMGLTGTINYLFPVIFTEEQMPKELLESCQNAITERQNVVHNGQRQVDRKKLYSFLASIRKMCTILNKFQGE